MLVEVTFELTLDGWMSGLWRSGGWCSRQREQHLRGPAVGVSWVLQG